MSDTGVELEHRTRLRPVGFMRPDHERALKAMKALNEKRLSDAEKHIAALPDSPGLDGVWKLLLAGLLAIECLDFKTAETALRHAAELAQEEKAPAGHSEKIARSRLASVVLEKIGWLRRRRDRAEQAYEIHLKAYRLREAHGSIEELWETAVSLGQDAYVAQRWDDAERWFGKAVALASEADQKTQRLRAIAHAHLAAALTNAGRHEHAVDAARSAMSEWQEHDPGGVETVEARIGLGYALLRHGEALVECADGNAREILEEALQRLKAAYEELLPFGSAISTQARTCLAQQDFANRLLAALGSR